MVSDTVTCGFIGLGLMGNGMARCMLNAGRNLVVWNRSPEKSRELQADFQERVTVVDTPRAVLEATDVTFCMLSTPEVQRSVYAGESGILAGVSAGKSLVDCATVAAADMTSIAEQVRARGGRFLEAPVSGSKVPAEQGQLIFLAAGDKDLYAQAAPDFDAMGKKAFHLGEVGAGSRMELVVNMLMGSMMTCFGEALSLCEATGGDGEALLEVLSLGAMANPMFKLKGPKMLAGDHAANFPLVHARKDVALAVELGRSVGQPLPVAAAADAEMKRAIGESEEILDFSAVIESQKKQRTK